MASYYESVGLLALCDAVDSELGVPFNPEGPPKVIPLSPSLRGRPRIQLPGPYPPVSFSQTTKGFPQHAYLSHLPLTVSTTSSGTMSFSEEQRAAFNQIQSQRAADGISSTPVSGPRVSQPVPTDRVTAPAAPISVSQSQQQPTPQASPAIAVPNHRPSLQQVSSIQSDSHGFRVEECPICNRVFRGPKASTHKQQHIRRLHPDRYTPKRGGKKRIPI